MILEIKKLYYSYKNYKVLKGLDFSATRGECIFILGENGAGKTTFFRCLLGFIQDYKGTIQINKKDCKNLSTRDMAKYVAYVPQSHSSIFNYSVYQIVLMGTNILTKKFHTPSINERDKVFDKLELLGISHLVERRYSELSGGERQLVLIARALVQEAKILIMDEPTANLDYGNQLKILNQVKRLSEQGYLILLTTHNPEHALLFANKVIVLKNGKIIENGNPLKVISPELIEYVYGVTVEMKIINTEWGKIPILVPRVT